MKEVIFVTLIGGMFVFAGVAMAKDLGLTYWVLCAAAFMLHIQLFRLKDDEPKGGEYDGIES